MPGSKPACGSPGLIAACHALLRRLSRAIHQAAWQQAKALVFSIQLCGARIGNINIIPSCLHPRLLHLGLHDKKSPKILLYAKVRIKWEVIQPQVPLRLPCYDLPALAEPRLDLASSRRRRLDLAPAPLGQVDGRCVQGAGTYSPRDVDARLLGIPGSRGRVAALDPNYGRVLGICSPSRGRIPLSRPLQPACGPGD